MIELTFDLTQKLLYHQKIELFILKIPSKEFSCDEEINLWLELGWIKLYQEGDLDEFKRTTNKLSTH